MLRKFTMLTLCGVLGALSLAFAQSASIQAEDKKEEKVPTIKEIMQKGHKGTDAFISKIKAEAKTGKWDEAKDHAKALALFGEYMVKNKPAKNNTNDPDSWGKLSKKYLESTKATLKAVEDKDAKAVEKALAINCMECHKAHR